MGSFQDNQGRSWSIALTIGAVKRIRSDLHVDVIDLREDTFLQLVNDAVLMNDLIWILCQAQAKDRNVNEEDFAEAIKGGPASEAIGMVLEAIPDFFHAQKRDLIRKAVAKAKMMREKAEIMTTEVIEDATLDDKLIAGMKAGIEREIQNILTQLTSPTN